MFLQHVTALMQDSSGHPLTLAFVYSSFLFFFHAYLASAAPATRYYPDEIILLNCGSSGNSTATDEREWVGDFGSRFASSSLLNQTSLSARAPHSHGLSIDPVPYKTVRFFRSQFTYTFHVKPGQKFIRLHFYPASFPGFLMSQALFSVKAGPYTLLRNFRPALAAHALEVNVLVQEFSVNINDDQRFINITFLPSSNACKDAFAFINGIEIVSMPINLYYAPSSGYRYDFPVTNNTALETVHRLNVGGRSISPKNDSGMYRRWLEDGSYLLEAGDVLVNTTHRIRPSYAAPDQVYQTARSMSMNKEVNMSYNLTWKLPVDSGFKYLVRLHFCAFQGQTKNSSDRQFHIYINNETAEAYADVITWSGDSGIPIYRDYAVSVHEGNAHLLITLNPNSESKTLPSDAILNGLEIFKLNKSDGSLGRPNPVTHLQAPHRRILKHSHRTGANKSRNNKVLLIGIGCSALGGGALLSLFGVTILCCRRLGKNKSRKVPSVPKKQCRRFSLAEIRAATHNFSKALVIGEGGFGRVYKGFIDGGETPVAIKVLEPTSEQGALEFWTEIDMLSRLRHHHLVSLIGYCSHPRAMILVYDYMPQGSLRDHLYKTDKPPLTWEQRLEICIGAAQGLEHLHKGSKRKIIHRDVKTTNILLDEKWVAKVSDFGLCKVGPANMSKSHITTNVKGTFGYLDPEYFWSQKLTEKSDVYGFGVVLFEVLCARPAVDMELEEEQWSLAQWGKYCVKNGTIEQMIDPHLMGKIAPESLKVYTYTAYRCVLNQSHKRPKMAHVLNNLVEALELQQSAEAGEADSHPSGINGYKLDEKVLLCPRELEPLSIPSRRESLAHTCPVLRQGSVSPKELIRFLSAKAGSKLAKTPSTSE